MKANDKNKNDNNNNNNINNDGQNNNDQTNLDDLKTSVENGNFFKYKAQPNNNKNKKISSNDIAQIYNNYGKQLIHNLKFEDLEKEVGVLNNEIAVLTDALKDNGINASEKQKRINKLTNLTNIKKNFIVTMDK